MTQRCCGERCGGAVALPGLSPTKPPAQGAQNRTVNGCDVAGEYGGKLSSLLIFIDLY